MKKILLFLLPIFLSAQPIILKEADEAFKGTFYKEASEIYQKAFEKKSVDKGYTAYQIAECYRLQNNYSDAQKWYEQSNKERYEAPLLKYHYGITLMRNAKYDMAVKVLEEYLSNNTNDLLAKQQLENAKYAKLKTETTESAYIFKNLKQFNSNGSDYSVGFYGLNYVFASTKDSKKIDNTTDDGFSDLYTALYDSIKNNFGEAIPLKGNINGKYNEGTFISTNNGSKAYFTQCNDYSGKKDFCAIYTAEKSGNEWINVQKVTIPSIENTFGQPAISRNDNTLLFSTEKEGGIGGKDIWLTKKKGGAFNSPVNIKVINTPGTEVFPFLQGDSILFFASDGHLGWGGLDMYYSKITKDGTTWVFSEPINMGISFNTSYDDFAVSFMNNAASGFISSNRKGGQGKDDIYFFERGREKLQIKGQLLDNKTNTAIIGAKIYLMVDSNTILETTSDANGNYKFENLTNDKQYKIRIEHPIYRTMFKNIEQPERLNFLAFDAKKEDLNKTVVADVGLLPQNVIVNIKIIDKKTNLPIEGALVSILPLGIESTSPQDGICKMAEGLDLDKSYEILVDKKTYFKDKVVFATNSKQIVYDIIIPLLAITKEEIKLNNIYYDLGKATLRPNSIAELDKLYNILINNPDLNIQINAHTDVRGSDESNLKLSEARAKSVLDYLIIKKNISNNRLTSKGWGEIKPEIVDAKTEDEHQQNRRTTFNITNLE